MLDRKLGWYWVRYQCTGEIHKWEIAYWTTHDWALLGSEEFFVDSDFYEIDETPITVRYQ